MTQRPDRQPEDVDSPLLPAADPDLEDGTEASPTHTDKTAPNKDERADDDRRD